MASFHASLFHPSASAEPPGTGNAPISTPPKPRSAMSVRAKRSSCSSIGASGIHRRIIARLGFDGSANSSVNSEDSEGTAVGAAMAICGATSPQKAVAAASARAVTRPARAWECRVTVDFQSTLTETLNRA